MQSALNGERSVARANASAVMDNGAWTFIFPLATATASAGPPGDALPTFDAATGELKFPIGVAPDDVAAEVERLRRDGW